MPTVDFRGTLPDLLRMLNTLPALFAGEIADVNGVARSLQMRGGVTLLSKVQQAFIVKSRGGVGDDGIAWPPLKRSTIANRRTTAAERKAAGVSGKRVRGLLTPAQDKRWRQIYGTRLARLRLTMGEGAAKARAAQIAWAILKSEGAKTKLDLFGGRKVDTLRDTGRLLRSLSPGVEDRPSGAPEQIFNVGGRGLVVVGTNVPYAGAHQNGVPGRIPKRLIWPENGEIPEPWGQAIVDSLAGGVARAIVLFASRGGIQ
jgi:hypothetical protein